MKRDKMECPECGANMELEMDYDDTGDYFWWVCYQCGYETEPNIYA